MRYLAALGVLALCACARSNPSLTPSTVTQPTRIQTENANTSTVYEIRRVNDNRAFTRAVGASREATWRVLAPLFGEMGLPVTGLDTAAFTIASDAEARRRFLGSPLDTYLDCGISGATRAPIANSYAVRLQVASLLKAVDGGNTEVQLLVRGHARDPVNSGPALPCTSTGRLEQRIMKELNTRLAPQ